MSDCPGVRPRVLIVPGADRSALANGSAPGGHDDALAALEAAVASPEATAAMPTAELATAEAAARRAPYSHADGPQARHEQIVFDVQNVSVSYGQHRAIKDVTLPIHRNLITAVIGPSGCGKSTFLRSLNRMNDSVKGFAIEGKVLYHGHDVYGASVDPVEVRRRIGMVFQRPNPFPKSIYDNVAWAPRNLKMKDRLDERVERALGAAALWDEVKDRLHKSALGLSGGQQQRLCIARAIAIEPDVLLLDEPASALDPIATSSIEELMQTLKHRYTIVIVTHNMQQAARIADRTAFFSVGEGERAGVLVEYDRTDTIFTRPRDPRTSDYVTGRFG
jgi:phosphate transport system ATP-binding protein